MDALVEDDPVVEMEATEEEAFKEDAVEAHVDEDEQLDNFPDIDEAVGEFRRGPRDSSLLTHYVQHVAYAISQGRVSGKLNL